MDVKHAMRLTLFLVSYLIYCHSLTVVVDNSRRALSSPDLETMNTPTDETGQKQVPDLSLVRDGAGRVDSHTVSSAWLNDGVDNSGRVLSSPDLETMNTHTDETGQKQVPDLSLVRDGAGRVDSHTGSSAWLNDVRRAPPISPASGKVFESR